MLRLVCWRWQEGKLPLPYRFTAVGPLWQPCAPHPLQDRGEATSRRRPRNGEDGSSAWNSCRWFVHRSRRHLTIIWKTGFQTGFSSTLYICHLFVKKHFSPQVCRPKDLSPPPINFSFGTLGRMVKPVKRFQHRGMIPVLGPRRRRAPRTQAYRRSRVRSPVRPRTLQFFLPRGPVLPKSPPCETAEPGGPPMHPREREDPRMRLRPSTATRYPSARLRTKQPRRRARGTA